LQPQWSLQLPPDADFTDLIAGGLQKAAKPSPHEASQAENRMKPDPDQIAGYRVRYQKELILLVFCG
jgi:hypothetical protein